MPTDLDLVLPSNQWFGNIRQRTFESHYGPLTEFDATVAQHAHSVAYVLRSDGEGGTGFLVAPDLLLTNQHVLRNAADAAGCTVWFDFTQGVAMQPQSPPAFRCTCVTADPDGFFLSSPANDPMRGEAADAKHLDYALVRIKWPDGLTARPAYVPITGYRPDTRPGMDLTIIQHPQHLPTYAGQGPNQLMGRNDWVIQYVTDTEYGSSGSPVFNKFWQLVGLHHARVALPGTNNKGNEAIFITAIVNDVKARAPQIDLPGSPAAPPAPTTPAP